MRAFRRLTPAAASALLLGSALLSGCALPHRRPEPWALPRLETGTLTGRYVQSLRLERQGKTLELMAVIENDGKAFTLVGLSPMGQRLMRLTWSEGRVAQESDPGLPVRIDGEAILRDVVFVNWPEAALRTVFAGTRWSARFDGGARSLDWNGRPWIVVRPEVASADAAGSAVPDIAATPATPATPAYSTDSTDTANTANTGGSKGGIVVNHVAEGYRVHVITVERDAP